ncbi:MAG: head-tail connector protein, partial [Rickettsiales bacterium]
MQIIMLSTRYGSEDGFVVRRFLQNYQYEIADSLGAYFIRLGVAVASSSISGRGNIFLKEKIMSNNRERLLERISAPATEPITLAEAKLYLRVDSSSEDNLITDLIVAARMSAEAWLKNSLISQSWKLVY